MLEEIVANTVECKTNKLISYWCNPAVAAEYLLDKQNIHYVYHASREDPRKVNYVRNGQQRGERGRPRTEWVGGIKLWTHIRSVKSGVLRERRRVITRNQTQLGGTK